MGRSHEDPCLCRGQHSRKGCKRGEYLEEAEDDGDDADVQKERGKPGDEVVAVGRPEPLNVAGRGLAEFTDESVELDSQNDEVACCLFFPLKDGFEDGHEHGSQQAQE